MPKPVTLTKAELVEMDNQLHDPLPRATPVRVQFNPESLKVTYSNQLVTGEGGQSAQTGTEALQYVGKGTTKLAVQLWFDVNHPTNHPPEGEAAKDVRDLTSKVAYFITPKDVGGDPKKYTIPGVQFRWGTFVFTGVLESLDESLELFSPDGYPLRASLSLGLTQQKIIAFEKGEVPPTTTPGGKAAGTSPLTSAPEGASVQSLAEGAGGRGGSKNWQDIAAANGIENPRLLAPGQLIDVNAKKRPVF
ncbi:MAG TPA: hypothetical protein VEX43_01920 [Chthoniobacterales bacterium]|nr:hypothetical protein [Chthoniobacterales bacterium]